MELCVWEAGEVSCLPVGGAGADWSPDGRWIAFHAGGAGEAHIYRVASDGGELQDLTGTAQRNARHPAWSPDGQRIAFVAPAASGADDIFVMNADGSQMRRITTNPQADMMPDWSPDAGHPQVVFVSWYEGRQGIYVVDVDMPQPEETRRLVWAAEPGTVMDFPVWSPDGEAIAFLYRPEVEARICLIAASGRDERPVCYEVGAEPLGLAWSPDGGMLAYAGVREERWIIETLDVGSGESRPLADQAGYALLAGLSWLP